MAESIPQCLITVVVRQINYTSTLKASLIVRYGQVRKRKEKKPTKHKNGHMKGHSYGNYVNYEY